MAFTRQLPEHLQNSIQNRTSPLLHRLLEDPTVFPAIRNGRVDFYHCGGKLFTFAKTISTHVKYASVLKHTGSYVTQDDLEKTKHLTDFGSDLMYPRIKENCALYAGDEAAGVFTICEKFSWHRQKATSKPVKDTGAFMGGVIVLDIEVSFKNEEASSDGGPKQRAQDRIDILLYNTATGSLGFVEAKMFSNPEIWAQPEQMPPIARQLKRYKQQIESRKEEILAQYREYVRLANACFNTRLPDPASLNSEVGLLIFGFDAAQRDSRLKKLLHSHTAYNNITRYEIGEIKKLNILQLWKCLFGK